MFALVDCNNFFASCETVFNPILDQKPLVILSNNDGCIIARSQKAKAAGVQMGDSAYLYKDRKDIVKLSANFSLYSDMSHRVMQTLSSFSPHMEIYSIDEAFFELEESASLHQECLAMRKKVKQWTGIPVSIGVGPTKTLAKLASERAKKEEGVYVLTQAMIQETLAVTELSDIWGIGANLTEKLKRKGIYSALQLSQADDTWIQKLLGITGYRTVLELRGTPCFDLNEIPEKRKSIVCSRTFGQKMTELPLIHEAIASFATRAAEKLREQESLASFLSIFLCSQHETTSCSIQIPNPTNNTSEFITLAKEGISELYHSECEYRKGGVMLGDFTDACQSDFITHPKKDRSDAMKVLDRINARYDKGAIRFAAEGIQRPWKSQQNSLSPKYTTLWTDLIKVR